MSISGGLRQPTDAARSGGRARSHQGARTRRLLPQQSLLHRVQARRRAVPSRDGPGLPRRAGRGVGSVGVLQRERRDGNLRRRAFQTVRVSRGSDGGGGVGANGGRRAVGGGAPGVRGGGAGGSGAASAEATRQPTASTRQPPALIPEGFLRVPSDEAPSAIPEGGHGGEGGHGEEGGRGGEGSRGRDSALASAPLASPGDSDYALAMALQAEYEAEAAREEAAARARREEASRATAGREVGGRASAPTRTAASSRPPQRRAPRRKKSAYDECAVM